MPIGGSRCGPILRRFSRKWASSRAWSWSIYVAATGCLRCHWCASQSAFMQSTSTRPSWIARGRVAETGAANCEFFVATAMAVDTVVPEPVDYVFLANTFHGVLDQRGLARVVAARLKPSGQFGIINWHRRPRKETVVLGQPRGPTTEMRIEAGEVTAILEPAGLLLNRTVELPPYHYGVVFKGGGNE